MSIFDSPFILDSTKEYYCSKSVKSTGFHLIHSYVLRNEIDKIQLLLMAATAILKTPCAVQKYSKKKTFTISIAEPLVGLKAARLVFRS